MRIPYHDYDGIPFTKEQRMSRHDKLKSTDHVVGAMPPLPVGDRIEIPAEEPAAPINNTDSLPSVETAPKPRSRRGPDPELQAMAKIDAMLAEFEDAAADRILDWVNNRRRPNGANP